MRQKGFAVVADEIRKLAVKSHQVANQIGNIIVEIVDQTKETVNTAKRAEGIVATQELALKSTVEVFSDVNSHVKLTEEGRNASIRNYNALFSR